MTFAPPILSPAALVWEAWALLPNVLFLAGGVALAVVLFYRPQLRAPRGRLAWLLPALRCAALVALVASALKPVAQRPRESAEQGAVVVLLDHSVSMSAHDPQRPAAQWVAIAEALGRIPPRPSTDADAAANSTATSIAASVAEVRRQLDPFAAAQRDLDFARLSGLDRRAPAAQAEAAAAALDAAAQALLARRAALKPSSPLVAPLAALAKLLAPAVRPESRGEAWVASARAQLDRVEAAASRSQTAIDQDRYEHDPAVRAACDPLRRLTRFDLATAALTDPANGLLRRLPPATPVYGFALGDGVEPLPLRGPASAGSPPVRRLLAGPGSDAPLAPDAPRTDPVNGVRAALDALRGVPVQAVVVFTDGRPDARAAPADPGLASAVPVFPVAVAPDAPPPDAAVVSLDAPQTVFAGQPFPARVRARGVGVPPRALLHLAHEDGEQAEFVPLQDKPTEHTFTVTLDRPGPQKLVARLPALQEEITAANNAATAWVKVVARKMRVLLVRGSAGWDEQYLARALSASAWAELTEWSALPPDPDPWADADVVLLDDVTASAFTPSQREALARFVRDRGGSVVVVAGRANSSQSFAGTPLAELLPFPLLPANAAAVAANPAAANAPPLTWRQWPGEDPSFRLLPAEGAEHNDLLQLADDPAASRRRWEGLPPIYSFLTLPPLKPGAKPLIVVDDGQTDGPIRAPVVIEQSVGGGRTVFVGTDETWRWRQGVGGRDQDRFWQQLVRTVAERPYAMEAGPLALDVDSPSATPGQPIPVRARLRPDPANLSDSPPASLPLEVRDDSADGRLIRTDSLPLAGPPAAGRYAATLPGLPPGDYRLRLKSPDGSASLDYPLSVAADTAAELADLSGDRPLLTQMANASGGQLLSLEEFPQLPQLLAATRGRLPGVVETRLWDSPYLYLFAAACLCAEWALRKRFGLA